MYSIASNGCLIGQIVFLNVQRRLPFVIDSHLGIYGFIVIVAAVHDIILSI